MNQLQIFSSQQFGQVRMVEIEGKPYAVAKDVASVLGYSNPRDAISRHCKGVVKHDSFKEGGQEVALVPEGDIYRLIIRSKLPEAEKFEQWVMEEVLPSLRRTGSYTLEGTVVPMLDTMTKQMALLQEQLDEMKHSALFKQNVNPRYIWERLIPEFFCAIDKPVFERYFYDAVGDWIGIRIKKSSELPDGVRVRDYAMSVCDTEVAKQFVSGVQSGRIVQSKEGHWVDLQGIFANPVEQNKIFEEFNHECSYCGSKDNLVIEHINPQRKYSQEAPEKVDLIQNTIVACPRCNRLKNDTMPFMEWYNSKLPWFKQWRLDKILRHIKKYEI